MPSRNFVEVMAYSCCPIPADQRVVTAFDPKGVVTISATRSAFAPRGVQHEPDKAEHAMEQIVDFLRML
jgi:hypothetical protein